MTDPNWLASQFEQHRAHLRSVAYDMLGSVSEAEDAVQECWLRLARSDGDSINELRSWLTAVLGRICIDMLRARRARRTDYVGSWLPEPLIEEPPEQRPDHQAELTDTLGLALLIVLESLSPPERLAFVLHDVFAVPFDEIAAIMDRSPAAARQLAARARRRIQSAPQPDTDVALQQTNSPNPLPTNAAPSTSSTPPSPSPSPRSQNKHPSTPAKPKVNAGNHPLQLS